nr:unnamed protein product [Fasciola hepatica]
MEAAYVFPLNDVALFNFEARIEDRIIVAECRPRAEAKTTYDDAVASGHTAYIAEQDEGCEDVFRMRLGNIPGRSAVTIMLKYVNQLDAESLVDDNIHTRATFTLPGFLNPRYTPKESRIDKEFDIIDRSETLKPYSMNFTGDITMPFRMIAVSSPHDKFEVEWRSTDQTSATVKLSAFQPDHDLQMVIDFEQKLDSFAVCEWGDRQANNILSKDCIMAQFIPDFTEFVNEIETRTEVYFIIDRSGSMSGSNIECAAESLLLFLKSLPSGCRFQIIGFGSTYETLFPEPVEYNEQSLARAIECQRKLEADLGGTEVYPALEEALKAPLTGSGWYKQIIFFTDGDVSNADEVIGLVRSHVNQACIFPIGIGCGASTYLVNGIARAGRGVSTFIRQPQELRAATMSVLNAALQPRASNVHIQWDLKSSDASGRLVPLDIVSIPQRVPPIFNGRFATIFGLLDYNHEHTLSGHITLECEVMNKKQTSAVNMADVISAQRVLKENIDLPLHRLAGKVQLNELSDQHKAIQIQGKERDNKDIEKDTECGEFRKKIEQLSSALNVISPFTAFVGVDPVKREPVKHARPSTPPDFSQCSGFACASMAATAFDVPDCALRGMAQVECDDEFEMSADDDDEDGQIQPVPSSVKPKERDPLLCLVDLQRADGSWVLDAEFCECLSLSLTVVQSAVPKTWDAIHTKGPVPEAAWATALALAYFETTLDTRASEWKLLARKASGWLMKQVTVGISDANCAKEYCDNLIAEAKTFLTNKI